MRAVVESSRIFYFLLIFLGAWCCLSSPLSADGPVILSKTDIQTLKMIDNQEKAAGVTQHILAWSPLISLAATDNLTDFVFTFTNTSFDDHARSIGIIDKVKACSILQVIDLHLIDHDKDSAYDFFTKLKSRYDPFCI